MIRWEGSNAPTNYDQLVQSQHYGKNYRDYNYDQLQSISRYNRYGLY